MCGGLPPGHKCGVLGTCVAAPIWFYCENLGTKCVNCIDALMGNTSESLASTHGHFEYNQSGQFVCWRIREPGSTKLEPFDAVTEINGMLTNEFFEKVYQPDGAATYDLTVYRNGQEGCLTITRA